MTEIPSDSPEESTDRAVSLFRELASRKKERPTAPPSYSRKVAVVLGALMGLGYGLCTQFINSIFSPAIPFSHHPFGLIGNCAASIVGMTLVSLACSWPKDSYRGALLACFTSVLLLELRAVAMGSTPLTIQLALDFSLFALIGIIVELTLSIPIMLIFRWTIEIQSDLFDKPVWSWQRIRLPLGFMAAVIALGFLSLYPADAREAMADMTMLVNEGIAAPSASALPVPLRNEDEVGAFVYYAKPPYTLELGQYVPIVSMLPDLPGNVIEVIARFGSGWTVTCLYATGRQEPISCRGYGPPDAPPVTDFRAFRLRPAS